MEGGEVGYPPPPSVQIKFTSTYNNISATSLLASGVPVAIRSNLREPKLKTIPGKHHTDPHSMHCMMDSLVSVK